MNCGLELGFSQLKWKFPFCLSLRVFEEFEQVFFEERVIANGKPSKKPLNVSIYFRKQGAILTVDNYIFDRLKGAEYNPDRVRNSVKKMCEIALDALVSIPL